MAFFHKCSEELNKVVHFLLEQAATATLTARKRETPNPTPAPSSICISWAVNLAAPGSVKDCSNFDRKSGERVFCTNWFHCSASGKKGGFKLMTVISTMFAAVRRI